MKMDAKADYAAAKKAAHEAFQAKMKIAEKRGYTVAMERCREELQDALSINKKNEAPHAEENASLGRISLKYDGFHKVSSGRTLCTFKLKIPQGLSFDDIFSLKEWCDNAVSLELSTKAWIERDPKEDFPLWNLKIKGLGKDRRCEWCRSFRTGLATLANRKGYMFSQYGACNFE